MFNILFLAIFIGDLPVQEAIRDLFTVVQPNIPCPTWNNPSSHPISCDEILIDPYALLKGVHVTIPERTFELTPGCADFPVKGYKSKTIFTQKYFLFFTKKSILSKTGENCTFLVWRKNLTMQYGDQYITEFLVSLILKSHWMCA